MKIFAAVRNSLAGAGKPAPLRGTIQKISIMKGGQCSVVVRFGQEEPLARLLDQGSLVELVEVRKVEQKPKRERKPKPDPETLPA